MTPRPDESQRRVIERRRALSPAKVVALSFLAAIAVGTLLLLLPFSQTPGQPVSLLDAFFTATSALCVTGLVVVDTGSAWTPFGQGVILLLIHIGGLGLVTLGTLLALLLGRRVGFQERLLAGGYVLEVGVNKSVAPRLGVVQNGVFDT